MKKYFAYPVLISILFFSQSSIGCSGGCPGACESFNKDSCSGQCCTAVNALGEETNSPCTWDSTNNTCISGGETPKCSGGCPGACESFTSESSCSDQCCTRVNSFGGEANFPCMWKNGTCMPGSE